MVEIWSEDCVDLSLDERAQCMLSSPMTLVGSLASSTQFCCCTRYLGLSARELLGAEGEIGCVFVHNGAGWCFRY